MSKGPLLSGSTVTVAPVDGSGEPLGQVFQAHTTNDLGQFSLTLAHRGPVLLEGSGYFFNELTGQLSAAPILLRAYATIDRAGLQSAFVNPITHMAYNRMQTLLSERVGFSEAREQAERELNEALGIGSVALQKQGVEMNVLGGDDDANAYVFAVGSVLTQAALLRDGSRVEGQLQELMNAIGLDLADDGAISPSLQDELDEARRRLPAKRIMENLARRLEALGSSASVPNLYRILGEDHEGDEGHGGSGGHGGGGGGGELSCEDGLSACGWSCRDLSVDPGNCGQCGVRCGALEACEGGSCFLPSTCGDEECRKTCEGCGADAGAPGFRRECLLH